MCPPVPPSILCPRLGPGEVLVKLGPGELAVAVIIHRLEEFEGDGPRVSSLPVRLEVLALAASQRRGR